MEEEARRREIRKTFKTFDSNGDGVITRNELADLMTALNNGAAPTPGMVEAQMRRLDRDGNGRIDEEEFVLAMDAWLTSYEGASPPTPGRKRQSSDGFEHASPTS